MPKIFHCADIHLDSPFSLSSPRGAERRRTELRAAFTSALMFARDRKADIFIISGDLFDGEYVTRDTREFITRELAKLAPMPVFIAPGNHDPFTAGSPFEALSKLQNVHVFGAARERVELPELGTDIYGVGFTSRYMLSSPVAGWETADPSRVNILVCHGDMTSASSQTAPITEAEIAASGFDYIALGHIHKASGVLRAGRTYYAYPGCIEGRGFDETGKKGALFGAVEKGECSVAQYYFSKCRYEEITVDIGGCNDKFEAVDRIRAAMRPYAEDTELRVRLCGELREPFNILPSEFGRGAELPRSIELVDSTLLLPDIGELEGENTLRGVFCRKMLARIKKLPEGSAEYRECELALRYGLAALQDRPVADYSEEER